MFKRLCLLSTIHTRNWLDKDCQGSDCSIRWICAWQRCSGHCMRPINEVQLVAMSATAFSMSDDKHATPSVWAGYKLMHLKVQMAGRWCANLPRIKRHLCSHSKVTCHIKRTTSVCSAQQHTLRRYNSTINKWMNDWITRFYCLDIFIFIYRPFTSARFSLNDECYYK